MEGPSLFLAAEQLAPFSNKLLIEVNGNTKIGKERLYQKKVLSIFSCGKHLVFQFDEFALRVHFLLFGSFEAVVKGKKVTGDYPKKNRIPRLQLIFKNGQIDLYSCSLKFLETSEAISLYDFSIDIMSPFWNAKGALKKTLQHEFSEIADVLLDQSIFAGVGNIIKNEVLFLTKKSPYQVVSNYKLSELRKLIKTTQEFSHQFYEWRKIFELRKHYQIYKKKICRRCGEKIIKEKTGKRERISYYCPHCQKLES